ncbi:MAG: carboxypeptidase-like regulatory domain-containing protein [Bryobacterales bacterium]
MRSLRLSLLVCACLLLAVSVGLAQNVTSSIAGVVTDASGAVVPGASVSVTNTGTNAHYTGSTTDLGTFNIRSLPVGLYDLSVEVSGFKKYEARGIRTQVNETARVDVALEVGQVAESVEVQANVVNVDTESATLKTVIDQRRVEDLPLNGRDPVQLMLLVAGVQPYDGEGLTSGTTYPGLAGVTVNGNRGNSTNFILDGGQNNDHYNNMPNPMPNPDALQEFSVQTNNFSAEFGRNSGGIVNAVTKSGTNELHGAAFYYLRHNKVNAANFFAPVDPSDPTRKLNDGLKRNQYGATIGGPVVVPGYNGRDKTFFFFSYQGTTVRRRPTSQFVNVMTVAERNGDFSALNRALKDPFGGGDYPNNQVPRTAFSPVTSYFIENYMPVPTGAGRSTTTRQVANTDDNQYTAKVDQYIGARNRLSVRGYWARANQPGNLNQSNFYEVTTVRDWRNTSIVVNNTFTVSPTVINQTVFSFNNTEGPASQVYPDKSWKDLGVDMTLDEFTQYHMTFQTINGPNTGDTNNFIRDEWQIGNTVRWTAGRHQVTFGGEYGHGLGDIVNNFRAQGQWRWQNTSGFTGYDLGDFLVGKFDRLLQGVGEFKNTRFDILNLFVNASMKVTRRLTVDLGVRWEPFLPYTDDLGKLSVWAPGQQSTRFVNAPAGVLYPGDSGVPDGGFPTVWGNWGPRTGFALDVFGDGRTSLRGGYGIFFDRSNTISTNSQANQGPFGTVVEQFGNAQNNMSTPWAGFTGGNPFPVVGFDAVGTDVLNPPSNVNFVLPHVAFVYAGDMRNAYVQSWNLTIERELAGGWIGRASYAGSKSTALVSGRQINAPLPDATATTSTINIRRPLYPQFGSVSLIEPAGLASYHSLQLTAERRFARGFSLLTNYTFGKAIDNNLNSANKATGTSVTDPLNQSFDRGPADFDITHVFNMSGILQIPGQYENAFARTILGGWSLTTIFAVNSGFPFSVLSGQDNARNGQGSQRAEMIGNPDLGDRPRGEVVQEYMSKAAFVANALGTYGTLGRNSFRGPNEINLDLGIHKDFAITERLRTQFRFEAFNALNRVNLNDPNTSVTNANFMRITSAGSPRILQFALRLNW